MSAMFQADEAGAERERAVRRILWVIMFLNLAVAAAKFVYGLVTGSGSMRADGIHSSFDSIGNLVCLAVLAAANRPADEHHPYGHHKFETYASAAIGVSLLVVAFTVASEAIDRLAGGFEPARVDVGSFAVMGVTLVMNVCVSRYEGRRGRELRSDMLIADSQNTMSDVWVSLSVIAGLALCAAGVPVADPIVSLVVALFIVRAAVEVFRQVNVSLVDRARLPEEDVKKLVEEVDGVHEAHAVRTRGTEDATFADMHVLVDPSMTVTQAHAVASNVERAVKAVYPQVVDVVVHIEPDNETEREEAEEVDETLEHTGRRRSRRRS